MKPKRAAHVYRFSSIEWSEAKGVESPYTPKVWCHPVYSEGEGGIKLVFGSLAEFAELVNTLSGSLNAARRRMADAKRRVTKNVSK